MMWAYYVAGWLLVGLVAVSCAMYNDYNEADDFTLGDLGMVVATVCTGPIFAVWYIKEYAADIVLVKGKHDDY